MSVMTRFALLSVVFVATLALGLSPGSAHAATEDVSASPGESAQGKPDDWGTPGGRPDDWGVHGSGSPDWHIEDPHRAPILDGFELGVLGRPDDFGQGVTDGFTVRIVEILNQLRFRTRT